VTNAECGQRDRVDIWYVDLSSRHWECQESLATLSREERSRAERFRSPVHGQRFRAARAALRSILAVYVEGEPANLCFEMNACGKPRLVRAPKRPYAHFNVSHSEALAAVAVSREHAVGVDVERIHYGLAFREIALRFFAPSEAAVVCAPPKPLNTQLFFRCWTRKEAFVKACGEGLKIRLDSFDVRPNEEGPIFVVRGAGTSTSHWTVTDIAPAAVFAGAVAVQGNGGDARCGWWPCPATDVSRTPAPQRERRDMAYIETTWGRRST
jgi:4'-phosphopantetheinyl transferase